MIKTLKYLIPDRRPACGTRTEYHESSQDGGDVGKTKRDHQGSVLRTDHVKGSVLISEKKQHPSEKNLKNSNRCKMVVTLVVQRESSQ